MRVIGFALVGLGAAAVAWFTMPTIGSAAARTAATLGGIALVAGLLLLALSRPSPDRPTNPA